MNRAQYAAFVRETRAEHDDEEAARIIERTCHPPYCRPRRDVLFPPATSGRAEGKGTVAVTESAQGVTRAQDGAA